MEKNFEGASFYFGGVDYKKEEGEITGKYDDISAIFHEAQIEPRDGHLGEDILQQVQTYLDDVNADTVTVERGDGLSVNLLSDGEVFANIGVDVLVTEETKDNLLANGDTVADLADYDWEKIDELDAAVQEQEEFAKGMEDLEGPTNGPEL